MTKIHGGLAHLNGNLLAAVDLETTGTRAGYHEPIQIAVVPLNSDLRPLDGVRPFYSTIRPTHTHRAERSASYVHKLDLEYLKLHAPEPGKVVDLFVEWWQDLELPFEKNLVPLAHNWAFEAGFLKELLGIDLFSKL